MNPASADAHCRRGYCLYLLQRWGEAAEAFERAAELNPASVETFRAMWDEARQKASMEEGGE